MWMGETRILVTGAVGLIGTVLTAVLRAHDIESVGFDLRSERLAGDFARRGP
jgi:nucleoside-diphosphate-sugar epimerase